MNSKSLFLTALLVMGMGLISFAQLNAGHYKIYSTKSAKEVQIKDIVMDMANADVLFFGEGHNDSVAHFLEVSIFQELHKVYGANLALSLEMFERDVQTVMNEYLTGLVREKNFLKDARVWSNYRDYRPMVEYAKANKLHVICANAASRYTGLAGRSGMNKLNELPAASKVNFAPVPYDTASGAYREKLMALSGHGPASTATPLSPTDTAKKKAPVMSMGSFNLNLGQSLWDATMAYSIAEFRKAEAGKKVFHVNGRFHSDEYFAVVSQLKKYSPQTKSLVISCVREDEFNNVDWKNYEGQGDYIILTDPKIPTTYDE